IVGSSISLFPLYYPRLPSCLVSFATVVFLDKIDRIWFGLLAHLFDSPATQFHGQSKTTKHDFTHIRANGQSLITLHTQSSLSAPPSVPTTALHP
ncbi:MAG: hypothetical protein JXR84_13225, partial [Anaerolineae bacterium]|nr:hypothetical protein [Anaerolineae bacterium]